MLTALRARLAALRPTGPLAWLRGTLLAVALIVAFWNVVVLMVVGDATWTLRLVGVLALATLVAWWVAGYSRGGFSSSGAPLEALALSVVAIAAAEGLRAFGLIYVGLLLRSVYATPRAFVIAFAAHYTAVVVPLLVAPGDVRNPFVYAAAQLIGLTVFGGGLNLIATILGRYEGALVGQIDQQRQEPIAAFRQRAPIRIEVLATFGPPVDEVFGVIADVERSPRWQSWLSSVQCSPPGPLRLGTRVTEVRRILGIETRATHEVTVFEPNRRWCIASVDGPIDYEATVRFEPMGGGTIVQVIADVRTKGRFGDLEPLVGRMAKREIETNLANLNDMLYLKAESL